MKRCPPLAGIEVDGYSHFLDEVILKDKIKEKALKEAGYEVIRFTDKQVLKDIQNVIAKIEKNIEEFERQDVGKFAKVHPSPRQRGTSLLPRYLLKKIFFLLKNKIVNDHKNFINQNRFTYKIKS